VGGEDNVDLMAWLHELGRDADPSAGGFQAGPMYVLVCVAMPVAVGLFVGWGLRLIERVFGIELGKSGGH
jgi:hypothetical protein